MLKIRNVELLLLMALFSVGAAAFLFLIGQDALDGQHPVQFFAASSLDVDATGLLVELLILNCMPEVKALLASAFLRRSSLAVSQELLL